MPEPLIERAFLERLERLTLQWQKSFHGLVGGRRVSHFAGAGQEFLDHRNFHSGDDLRAVNWRAFLRLEKLFVKMFQIEPHIPMRLLLDVSASMGTTSAVDKTAKLDYVKKLAAALVYVALVRLDTVILQPFAEALEKPFTCSGGRHTFQQAEMFLRELQPAGKSDYLNMARQFLTAYEGRGLTILISDFLGENDCKLPLEYLSDFGHELLVIQVWSTEDREPSDAGEVNLIEAESGAELRVSVDRRVKNEYTRAFDDHALAIRKLALRSGGRYLGIPTSVPIADVIFGSLIRMSSVA